MLACCSVEALVSGHPWDAKIVSITGAGHLQRIQVECLMVSVVAFVVTVELIALRGKMADVARQE